jgi:hypothetical protein
MPTAPESSGLSKAGAIDLTVGGNAASGASTMSLDEPHDKTLAMSALMPTTFRGHSA